MPNSLDRDRAEFETAWIDAHPEQHPIEAIAKQSDGDYWYQDAKDAWRWWQAGAAAERERKDEKPVCRHVNTQPMWDHMACLDCGSVRPDGNKTGRPNKGWFRSMDSFRNWDRSAP